MRCWFGKCNFLHICSEESGKKTAKDNSREQIYLGIRNEDEIVLEILLKR